MVLTSDPMAMALCPYGCFGYEKGLDMVFDDSVNYPNKVAELMWSKNEVGVPCNDGGRLVYTVLITLLSLKHLKGSAKLVLAYNLRRP